MTDPDQPYPPEPWDLQGRGDLTVWRVPATDLPPLPHGVRPVVVRGQALAVTAFVDYAEGGLLAYHELLAAVVVRDGRGPALSITDIWVDSPTSLAGGRGLWGIPKETATFTLPQPASTIAREGEDLLGWARFRPGRLPAVRLPGRLRGRVVQTLDGRTAATRITASGRVRRAEATWRLPTTGRLGWLAARRELLSVSAEDFRLTFGPVLDRDRVTAR